MIAVDVAQEAGERASPTSTKEIDANFWELLDHALEGRHFASQPVVRSPGVKARIVEERKGKVEGKLMKDRMQDEVAPA
jgi:hypothetical protein